MNRIERVREDVGEQLEQLRDVVDEFEETVATADTVLSESKLSGTDSETLVRRERTHRENRGQAPARGD